MKCVFKGSNVVYFQHAQLPTKNKHSLGRAKFGADRLHSNFNKKSPFLKVRILILSGDLLIRALVNLGKDLF